MHWPVMGSGIRETNRMSAANNVSLLARQTFPAPPLATPVLCHFFFLRRGGLEKHQNTLKPVEGSSRLDGDLPVNIALFRADDMSHQQALGINLVQAGGDNGLAGRHSLIIHHVMQLAIIPAAAL